jgi:anti-anti-sigma regulatory factor
LANGWQKRLPVRVSAVDTDQPTTLSVAAEVVGRTILLTARGILDATSYLSLRDKIIKAALDDPQGVIVDVSDLSVPQDSAWAVFTSARWHVGRWPETPIVLVCAHLVIRNTITRNGIARYVPVYPTVERAREALSLSDPHPCRRRMRIELPANATSLRRSRDFVAEWLQAWSMPGWVAVAKVVVTAFVENVLHHTDSAPRIRLETDGDAVTVAVEDASHLPAVVQESAQATGTPTGLRMVGALCRTWGNSPTPSGKTVWAVMGPENRL